MAVVLILSERKKPPRAQNLFGLDYIHVAAAAALFLVRRGYLIIYLLYYTRSRRLVFFFLAEEGFSWQEDISHSGGWKLSLPGAVTKSNMHVVDLSF